MNAAAMRIAKLETSLDLDWPETNDRAHWDWYTQRCPCGVAPGSCRLHPRRGAAQRPPEGDWRTWLAAAGRGWAMLLLGLRLGSNPRVCVTTTPRANNLVRRLVEAPTTRKTGEELIDALPGGIRDVFPAGRRALPALSTVRAGRQS